MIDYECFVSSAELLGEVQVYLSTYSTNAMLPFTLTDELSGTNGKYLSLWMIYHQ
jgi:hypothetical protein